MTNKKVSNQLKKAKSASATLGLMPHAKRNAILKTLAKLLRKNKNTIIRENAKDVKSFIKERGENHPMADRLILNSTRIEGMARELESLAKMGDPIGELFDCKNKSGLKICRKRVPLGVIGVIYESRPNVTTDVAGICIKSGNAGVLKGGKEAKRSYVILHKIIREALKKGGADPEAIQFLSPEVKDSALTMIRANGLVDMVVPRGSAGLIKFVRENATVPAIETGAGVCHTFVDKYAKLDASAKVIFNAKTQRPSVCNSLDTLIIDRAVAKTLLQKIGKLLQAKKVEIFADPASYKILQSVYPKNLLKKARPGDFGREFLDLKMSVKVVSGIDEAIKFIKSKTSGHSEAILSENKANRERFLNEIDSAVVYANASTRFSDGAVFGLGSEIGISTDKVHARGPMGPKEMTTYKWVVSGHYSTRK